MDFLADILKVIVGIFLFLLLVLVLIWWLNPDLVRNHPWYQRASQNIQQERGIAEDKGKENQQDSENSQKSENEQNLEKKESGEGENNNQNETSGEVGQGPNKDSKSPDQNQEPGLDLEKTPDLSPQPQLKELTFQEKVDKLTKPLPSSKFSESKINQIYFFSFKINNSDSWIARINRTNKDLNGFYLNQQSNKFYNLKGKVYEDNSWFLEEFETSKAGEKIARFKVSTSKISANRINLSGYRTDSKQEQLETISGLQIESMPELSSNNFTFNNLQIEVKEIQENQEGIEIKVKYPKFTGLNNANFENKINQEILNLINLEKNKKDLIKAKKERKEDCEKQQISNCKLEYIYDLNYKINYNRNNLLSILFVERMLTTQGPVPRVRYYGFNYDLRNNTKLSDQVFFEGQNWESRLVELSNGKTSQNLVYDESRVGGLSFNSNGIEVIISPSFFEKNKLLIPISWDEINFLNPALFNQRETVK
jgi:Deacetylase PdaC